MKLLCLVSVLMITGCVEKPTQQAVTLDAGQATLLARQLANERAQTLYQCQPFRNGSGARLEGGRWMWQERRGYRFGDMEARVSFALDGSARRVEVLWLVDGLDM